LLSTFVVGTAQVGVSAATLRQKAFAPIAESIDHRATGTAALAAHPEILGLEGSSLLEEL